MTSQPYVFLDMIDYLYRSGGFSSPFSASTRTAWMEGLTQYTTHTHTHTNNI